MNSQDVERAATARTRRAFLTLGAGAVAGYGGWRWLRSRPPDGGVASPFRNVLRANEDVAGTYFSGRHLSPKFTLMDVDPQARVNGNVGIEEEVDPRNWMVHVNLEGANPAQVSIDQIRALPRVEQITQLNCIEGWTMVVQWAGARFADFTERFAPQFNGAKYVGMETPDQRYYVGLDAASALHPQTLLCYEMNGAPLASAHGAPLRLVIPVKYGVKNIKRIGMITYTNERPGDYWANEGYDWYAGL